MNENVNICEIIKNKVSRCDELSCAEALHAEKCPACAPLIEEAITAVSASAHLKIRALQKIDPAFERAAAPSRNFSAFKLSAAAAILLIAVLLIPYKNIETRNSINDGQTYNLSNIEIKFPELSGSGLAEEIESYFESQSEIIDKIFAGNAISPAFSEYENASPDISLDSIAKTFNVAENGEDKYSGLFSMNGSGTFENISMDESIY